MDTRQKVAKALLKIDCRLTGLLPWDLQDDVSERYKQYQFGVAVNDATYREKDKWGRVRTYPFLYDKKQVATLKRSAE